MKGPAAPWLFLIASLVIFLRGPAVFLHPVAGWEDAAQGINYYVHAGASPLHFYAGYISVLPNLFDYAAVRVLPLWWVPFAQAWFALAMAACVAPALMCFFRSCAGFTDRAAAITALVIGCLPLSDAGCVSIAEFSIWSMLAVLMLTALNPVPASAFGQAVYAGWRLLFLTSNPVAVVLCPLWLGRALHERRTVLPHGFLAAASVAYVLWGTLHTHLPAVNSQAAASLFTTSLRLAVEKSLFAVVLRGVFGINAHPLPALALMTVFAAIAAGMIAVHRRRARALVEIAWPIAALVAISIFCALGRGTEDGGQMLLASPRYHYVPKLLWAVALAVIAGDVRRGWQSTLVICTAAAAACLIWAKNIKAYHAIDVSQSSAILAFLREADSGPAGERRFARVGPDGDWSIVIDRKPPGLQ